MLLVIDTLASQITTPNHTMPGRREQKPKLLKRALFNATQRKGNPTAFITTYIEEGVAKACLFPKKRFSFFCPKYGLPVIVCDDFLTEENLFLEDHLKCFFQGMVHVFYSTAMFAITQKAQSG